jgi:hypothetical protein
MVLVSLTYCESLSTADWTVHTRVPLNTISESRIITCMGEDCFSEWVTEWLSEESETAREQCELLRPKSSTFLWRYAKVRPTGTIIDGEVLNEYYQFGSRNERFCWLYPTIFSK